MHSTRTFGYYRIICLKESKQESKAHHTARGAAVSREARASAWSRVWGAPGRRYHLWQEKEGRSMEMAKWYSVHKRSQWAWRSSIKGAVQYTCEVLLLFPLHKFIKFIEDIEGFHQS